MRSYGIAGLHSGSIMRIRHDFFKQAREASWERFGRKITFYLPGMFMSDGISGRYPAISITGNRCELRCDHCRGALLSSMIHAESGDSLVKRCIDLEKKGHHGVLISGGCDSKGRLPWVRFISAIEEIKEKTDLFISVHCGIVDDIIARNLKEAGVDQALIDVIGDDETYQDICHVPFGISRIVSSMESLEKAGLPFVPHIVCGIHHGKIRSEKKAVEMIGNFDIRQVAVVSIMRLTGRPTQHLELPDACDVAQIVAQARLAVPAALISLGCARPRGDRSMEILAIDAGVNQMALPSDEAVEHALGYGLEIKYQRTCCSVQKDFSDEGWKT